MIDLNGRSFSPVKNSTGGRVTRDAVFHFQHNDLGFKATYSGEGFTDGILIGKMTGTHSGELIYHCRAKDGSLEAGEAKAIFNTLEDGRLSISMAWQWLNGSHTSGTSYYEAIK